MATPRFYRENNHGVAIGATAAREGFDLTIVGPGGGAVVRLDPVHAAELGNWLTDAARSLQDCVDADAERRREVSA